jgi:hypothetical protein
MRISRSGIAVSIIITLAIAAAVVVVFRAAMRDKESSLGEVFTYDLEALRKTDPALIKYEEVGRVKAGFGEVSAVAVDSSDRIYVAGDRAIRIFDSNGDFAVEVKLADAPRCLTVKDDGTIYIGMEDHIEVYDPKGGLIAKWGSLGQDAVLTSVAVSGDDVFVADAGGRVVMRYDSSGKLVSRIGEKDADRNIPGFVIPSPYFDLAVASDGLLRVANTGCQRIEAYTFGGDLEFSWGRPANSIEGFLGCCNPANFAILPDGGFVTCEKGVPRVKVYSADGVFESVVAGAELFAQSEAIVVLDVAVDSRGRIMVLDPVEKAVRIFERYDND